MSDGMYVGMGGASARMLELDSLADNLANAETPGFLASQPTFESVMASTAHQAPDQVNTTPTTVGADLRPGGTFLTGRPLDVVPQQGAFLVVQSIAGQYAYTRNGSIQVDSFGRLNVGGELVTSDRGQPITVPPGQQVSIGDDGTVYAGSNAIDKLGMVQLSGPVERVSGSLITVGAGGQADQIQGKVQTGSLEHSNVNPLQITVELVNAQRQYETAMQAIQTYRTMSDHTNDLGRVR